MISVITGPVHVVDILALMFSILAVAISVYNLINILEAKKHAKNVIDIVSKGKDDSCIKDGTQ
jgi:hypothetical protein